MISENFKNLMVVLIVEDMYKDDFIRKYEKKYHIDCAIRLGSMMIQSDVKLKLSNFLCAFI